MIAKVLLLILLNFLFILLNKKLLLPTHLASNAVQNSLYHLKFFTIFKTIKLTFKDHIDQHKNGCENGGRGKRLKQMNNLEYIKNTCIDELLKLRSREM